MDQALGLSLWLGMAGLALGTAYLFLWRTRHVLDRSLQDAEVADVKLAPAALRREVRHSPGVKHEEVRRGSGALQKST